MLTNIKEILNKLRYKDYAYKVLTFIKLFLIP